MLRPILAFVTMCVAAFLLAPTVASVHAKFALMDVDRDLPFELFKWIDEPEPGIPGCGYKREQLFSEIVKWPDRIEKDQIAHLEGIVHTTDDQRPVEGVKVEIFINATKEKPGILWATVESDAKGVYVITQLVPFDLPAAHYHIVAHAHEKTETCTFYKDFWTDPETDVVSASEIKPVFPRRAIVGYNTTIGGRLVDSVGAPIPEGNLTVRIGNKTVRTNTTTAGEWSVTFTPTTAGDLTVNASFNASRYYRGSHNVSTLLVLTEDVELPEKIEIDRSSHALFEGVAYPPKGARKAPLTVAFEGVNLSTCAGCDPKASHPVDLDDEGRFSIDLFAPHGEAPGPFQIVVSGGGLESEYRTNGTLFVPTTIALHPEKPGLFNKRFGGNVTLRDDAGEPITAPVLVAGHSNAISNATDEAGMLVFSGTAPECGRGDLVAHYQGTDYVRGASDAKPVLVCGYLAYVPAWLLAIPWWGWLLLALGALGAYLFVPRLRERYATSISAGPPLTLVATEPEDAAAGIGAIGETLGVTAFLEAPLPDGHRLRLGQPHAMQEATIESGLQARFLLVPDRTGELAVRADVVDARGRVATRRTLTLRVVRYAQEIERRYLELRKGKGLDEAVSPREFEAWLRERNSDIEPAVARRLVGVFEEADYGPREAGRRELLEYLAAETAFPEVKAPAVV